MSLTGIIEELTIEEHASMLEEVEIIHSRNTGSILFHSCNHAKHGRIVMYSDSSGSYGLIR